MIHKLWAKFELIDTSALSEKLLLVSLLIVYDDYVYMHNLIDPHYATPATYYIKHAL